MVKVFQEKVFPHCHTHGYKLIVLDNDSKFHSKALVEAAAEEGLQIYPGSGKRCWVTSNLQIIPKFEDNKNGEEVEGKYPARSHDCMPDGTDFVETYQESQTYLERKEKNRNQSKLS